MEHGILHEAYFLYTWAAICSVSYTHGQRLLRFLYTWAAIAALRGDLQFTKLRPWKGGTSNIIFHTAYQPIK